MFSIIIPLYNKAAHIEKAIRSVLNQTYHEFELIIVDDGSTDHGVQLIERYLQAQQKGGNSSLPDNVRIIRQENSGVSVARNNGVKAAKYDYIAFLDADDWWHKRYLAEMKQLIDRYQEAVLFSASYFQVKHGHRKQAAIGVTENFTHGYIDYCTVYARTLCMPVSTIATIIRKTAFEAEGGFKPQLKLGEDFDLWVRIALRYKIAFLNKPLAFYNHDVEAQSRAVTGSRVYARNEHYIFNLDYLQEDEAKNSALKRLLDALRVYVLWPYYLNKDTREDARNELAKVEWAEQPWTTLIRYRSPIVVLKIFNRMMVIGSKIKQTLIRR